MELTDEFGRRMKARRQYFGWTQKELGDRVGISKGTVGDLESNRIKKTAFLPQIADTLEMKIDELLGNDALSYTDKLAAVAARSPVNLSTLANAVAQVKAATDEKGIVISDDLFSKISVILYQSAKKDLSAATLIELFCPEGLSDASRASSKAASKKASRSGPKERKTKKRS
ncbi:helix-turn-helix domain-containing protein [Aliikangiella coralliicola]|uniref:Helix-turn-helix transcriptional regulator n=1 Tax=Aliikangiella coralliicola TaxID=2592383 RepID=A0A545UB93_9GAMM|nr:helix-turn-helix transcriptional regulator [Aliikangiella coralliicola]TQV86734.1 helix-turn-helix transcriptional regulator [Aliikangiella coralliicola]